MIKKQGRCCGMSNISEIAKAYLEKECNKLIINLERALNRKGVTETEINALQQKIDINLYLQQRCE
jgi:hypothetical protein